MSKLEIDLPEDVSVDAAKRHLIMWLHQQGSLSAGKAAELLNLPYNEYIKIFSTFGGALFNYSVSDLDDEQKHWNS